MLVVGDEVVAWVAAQTNEFGKFGASTGIGWEQGGKLVAGVAYSDYNGANCCTHISVTGAMTRTFVWAIFDYPFNQMKVERITGLVGEGNEKSRHLCARLGFAEEARLKGAHPTGDMLVFRMRRDECKWLGIKHEIR